MDDLFGFDAPDANWKPLYKIGALAALTAVIVFRRYLAAELSAFNGFGIFAMPETMPSNALDWFTLLQHNTFVGLALLNVFDLINYFLVGLIFLALYAALRRVNRSAMVIALILGLVGIAVYFASNQAFGILHLSQQYAAATSEPQRTMYLAAGEALLAVNQGTGIYISLFLVLLAGLIISLVMLRSEVFGKGTAVFGIMANGLGLAYYPALAFAPTLVWIPPAFSAPFRIVWYVLIAIKLLKMSKVENASSSDSNQSHQR